MRHRFLTADVFTERIFGGNPLAVFPDARGLDTAQMQAVAREFNLSETVFVLPSEDERCVRRLRIFTPAAELPFAGHPTIGAALVLGAIGELGMSGECREITLQEGAGPVKVELSAQRGRPYAKLTAAIPPQFGAAPSRTDVAAALSLTEADLAGDAASVSCGVPFVIAPVRDRQAMGRARIDPTAFPRVVGAGCTGLLFFSRDPEDADAQIRARMFAPAMGVAEDPATGAAAVALAGLLASQESAPSGTFRWVIEQGVEMGRPSRLEAEADKSDGTVTATRVGGTAVIVSEGVIEVP